MFNPRRFLPCVLLPALVALAGCEAFSSDYWQSPSVLGKAPPAQEKPSKLENKGGFVVFVDGPGQPPAARVAADIGAYAQSRGFTRRSAAGAVPERYVQGAIFLDVAYQPAEHRVSAYLHSAKFNRKLNDEFYQGFDGRYGRSYGEEDPILESDYVDDAGGPLRGIGGGPGAERSRGSRER